MQFAKWAVVAQRIAVQGLDFDHLRAQHAQEMRAKWAGHDVTEIRDLKTGKRLWHARYPGLIGLCAQLNMFAPGKICRALVPLCKMQLDELAN